jgi:HK97 family phage major capsid protein
MGIQGGTSGAIFSTNLKEIEMLQSVQISRRQSEIRQELASLAAIETPSDDETRSMSNLDSEYRNNETRYRAALIAEDEERREAGAELETRSDREWSDLVGQYEVRQAVLALDEGRSLSGATNEIVTELRSNHGYRGVPVPWQALEIRAGETVSTGTPDPVSTRPIIDRLFPSSVAARMGTSMINITSGEVDFPVVTSSVSAGWAASETGAVASAVPFETADQPLAPDQTLGVQMKITRKSLKQSGAALEQAIRRDMNNAIGQTLDAAVFLGTGASGQPTGIFAGAAGWGITETAIDASVNWSVFRDAVVRFMTGNAATGPGDVRLMIRPEIWSAMDGDLITGTAVSEWDRLKQQVGSIVVSSNALAAPTGSPLATSAVMTTSAGGTPPIFFATWGAVDMIRDPYSDAASGGLRLTGLVTADLTISRASQIEILTGLQ